VFMRAFPVCVAILAWPALAAGQSVISVRAGVVNAFEGAVFIGGQPVSSKFGTFPRLREGADLYTQDGRAELLLSPDVFLRVGCNSAVRMVSGSLSDTQIRVLNGSVIFDSGNARSAGQVTLLVGTVQVRVTTPGRMRVDADPPQLRVEKGEARVLSSNGQTPVRADQMLSLAGDPVVRRMAAGNDDDLELWSQQRNRMIFLSLSTDQSLSDPGDAAEGSADLSAWLGYMPYSGVLPMTGVYANVPVSSGYTYAYSPYTYSPWLMGYSGLYYGAARYGVRYFGLRPSSYGIAMPPIRSSGIAPIRPGFTTIAPARGSVPVFQPAMPRPVVTRPVAPIRGPVHK
jgi:hypothetical protein